jgi:hypothetical protein
MGFRMKIEGENDTIELGPDCLEDVNYCSESSRGGAARSTDVDFILEVDGKIRISTEGDAVDESRKVAKWSLVSAEKANAYRNVILEVIAADQVVRKIEMPHAFVVDYIEDFGKDEGLGSFDLIIKQKKDRNDLVNIEGGYSAEE